jgi:hypothetical protein
MNTMFGGTSGVSESDVTWYTQQLLSCKLRIPTPFFVLANGHALSCQLVRGPQDYTSQWVVPVTAYIVGVQCLLCKHSANVAAGCTALLWKIRPVFSAQSIHTCQWSCCQYADVTRCIRWCGAEKWIRPPQQQPLFPATSAPDALMWLNHRSFSRESISLSASYRSLNHPQLNAGGFLQSKPFWPASHYRGQFTLAPHSGRTWN